MHELEPRILYEDNHLIIINKLPGELVQGDITGDKTLADTVKEYLQVTYQKPGNVFLGIPHRIDRPTSGVVVYTKTEKALVRMHALFRSDDAVVKTYWAAVDRLPDAEEGLVVHYITRDTKKNKSFATKERRKKSQEARMTYRGVAASKSFYLLEIGLLTGRHHQIRAQLAAMGSHVKGDLKYGAKRSNEMGGIHLHAREISFIHPVKDERLTVTALPPREAIWDYFVSVAAEGNQPSRRLGE
ncbi:MAG: RluA family pseudouridine synthase [Sphaerochaetaceae bacterium]|jgi:23S rRNA pseudouridine1911/1915/1917 synthase|nr:RluA family pseudouridine synthase [Sphaerochaetaceae bacterium]MDY0372341.1 RluA family pseudouridine synthase [Sphaerochaetaceae bacterium]